MRFFNSSIAAILTGLVCFNIIFTTYTIFTKPTPGAADGLGFIIFSVLLTPVLMILFLIVFYRLYKRINMKGLLFGVITGLWLREVLEVIQGFFYQSDQLKNTIRIINSPYLLLIIIMLSLIFVRTSYKWLNLNSFTITATTGFVFSYIIVLLLRKINNSLTSYFYFNSDEILIVVLSVFITSVLGIIIGKKNEKKIKIKQA
ncbi:hypothetical protein [Bacillus obstructivus]|uniref:hypothetical protein n=1 Tax=Heyndrickxia oleronia TaxID=38875 RepID=UPI000903B3ED|nr:hypothetical protein BLX88_08225 [Bacillus obstructivus]